MKNYLKLIQNKKYLGLLLTSVIGLLWFLLPDVALAQSTGGLNTSQLALSNTDQSNQLFFQLLFPNLNGSASPVAGVIGAFNGAVLFVAGIILAYTLMAGTVNTAHDGEMLGRRWSTVWLPIRISVGSAAIIPLFNGFCAIQIIVIWLAMQGAGLGNIVWTAFSGGSTAGGTASFLPAQINSGVYGVATALFEENICVDVNNTFLTNNPIYAAAHGSTTYAAHTPTTSGSPTDGVSQITSYGFGAGTTGVQCGTVLYTSPSAATGATGPTSSTSTSLQNGLDTAKISVNTVQASQLSILAGSMQSAATSYLANPDTYDFATAIQTATTGYVNAINSAASSAYSSAISGSTFQTDMQKDGWLFAGAYFMKFIQAQSYVNSAVSNLPAMDRPPNPSATDDSTDVSAAFGAINTKLTNSGSGVSTNGLDDASNASTPNNNQNQIQKVLSSKLSFSSTALQMFTNPQQNPIMLAKNLGDYIIDIGWGILAIGALGGAVSTGIIGIFSSSTATTLGFMLSMVVVGTAFSLFTLGAGLSIFIPMTPYIIWFGLVAAWMITVVEAVVAAPLWAVAHMKPDGDGIIGQAGQGYMLVLGLCLRPALAIIGLVFGMYIMTPLGYFLNNTFYSVFSMMEQDTLTGPITFIGMIGLYMSLLLACIKKSFSLIHVIPDQVLHWIGGNLTTQFGKYTGEAEQLADRGHQQAQQIGQRIGGGLQNFANQAGSRMIEKRQQGIEGARQKNANAVKEGAGSLASYREMADSANLKGQLADKGGEKGDAIQAKSESLNAIKHAIKAAEGIMSNPAATKAEKNSAAESLNELNGQLKSTEKDYNESKKAFLDGKSETPPPPDPTPPTAPKGEV